MNELKMHHLKKFFASSLLLTSCFTIPDTVLAKPVTSNCPPVNAIARKLKMQSPSSSLNVRRVSISGYWRNAPKGVLLDVSTVNVSTKPEFELAYSKKIISQCTGVVAVRFTMYRADLGQAYGLVKGRVKRFNCPIGKSVGDHPFEWGYECLP